MDILFLLVPLSVVLVFVILMVFAWALRNGQLDDVEREGLRILGAEDRGAETAPLPPGSP